MGKTTEEPSLNTRIVIFNHDTRDAEILPVLDVDDERIFASGPEGERSIPFVDATAYITAHGKLYVINAPTFYVQELKHLATVEMSRVIRAAVDYQRPGAAAKDIGWFKYLPWVAVLLFAILWMVKK